MRLQMRTADSQNKSLVLLTIYENSARPMHIRDGQMDSRPRRITLYTELFPKALTDIVRLSNG